VQVFARSSVGVVLAVRLVAWEGFGEGVTVRVDVAVGGGVQGPGFAIPLLFMAPIAAETATLTTRMAASIMI
jgi:hypothetical protein